MHSPCLPVFSNTSAETFPVDVDGIRERLARQIAQPVQFQAEIEAMYEAGARIFVEAGPGRVLTGLTSRILGDRHHLAVAIDTGGQHGMTQLLKGSVSLRSRAWPSTTSACTKAVTPGYSSLSDAPSSKPKATSWWVNGQRAWPVSGEPPKHAMLPVRDRLPIAQGQTVITPPRGDREAVVMEYLRSVRELVETQRRVMLGYLGADAPSVVFEPTPHTSLPAPTRDRNGNRPAEVPIEAANLQPAREQAQIDTAATLLSIISERTGYPLEMLGLDLDLEADLSIDSIKRIEILGALAERLGLSTDAGAADIPEDLVRVKTLQGIIDALTLLLPEPQTTANLAAPSFVASGSHTESSITGNNGSGAFDTRTALLDVVSTRTGYPVEMLDLDLNLEADLSIDSIKRIEILGALAERLGLGTETGAADIPDELVRVKTLQGIIEAFSEVVAKAQSQNGNLRRTAHQPSLP